MRYSNAAGPSTPEVHVEDRPAKPPEGGEEH